MKCRSLLSALISTALLLMAGCGSAGSPEAAASTKHLDQLNIDYATYNPLSLIIKENGWLEAALPGTKINWIQSTGSNKANENLRAGALDMGSTAGSAALLARSNGSPIKTIDVYSRPEWTGIVVRKDSPLTQVSQLRGKKVAVTKGTDAYFFLLQALAANGLSQDAVTVVNLQHADGRVALESGSVDAWSGLDPIMAASQAQAGSRIIYQNVDFDSYGVLDATESFLARDPDVAQTVVNVYERARAWARGNPDGTAQILAKVSAIDPTVARTTLSRTDLTVDPTPGDAQRAVLARIGPILVASGDVPTLAAVDAALSSLIDPEYAIHAVRPSSSAAP